MTMTKEDKRIYEIVVQALEDIVLPRFDDHDKRLDNLETKLSSLESRFDSLESRIGNLESQFKNLESQFSNFRQEFREEIAKIYAKMDQIKIMLEEDIGLAYKNIAGLEKEVGKLKVRVEILETKYHVPV